MKQLFYPKFAYNSIKKNRKLYTPYILTSVLWIMMFYIIATLSVSPHVEALEGGLMLTMLLGIGKNVVIIFSILFLFYTSSFLSKRRTKEYALYNILGMNKRNIAHILLWDSIITFGLSIIIGLLLGTVFFKLVELGLINIVKENINYDLYINWETMLSTFARYALTFFLILLKELFKIMISNPIDLLRSESSGEKPPKANWFIGILGLLVLGIAYYIALTVKNPVSATTAFLTSVLLVIIGTYFLFISCSVLLCRILQKNKSYYYKSNHFIFVSSMMHRMKRNGSGLASICILATMVLVMISSTTSLYFGMDDSLKDRYPREIAILYTLENILSADTNFIEKTHDFIDTECEKLGAIPTNRIYYKTIVASGHLKNGIFDTLTSTNDISFDNMYQLYMVPLSDYNRVMGKSETLHENEMLLYTIRTKFLEDNLTIRNGNTFHIKKQLDKFWSDGSAVMTVIPSLFVVVSDLEYATQGMNTITDSNESSPLTAGLMYGFDTTLSSEKQKTLYNNLLSISENQITPNVISTNFESRSVSRGAFFGLYGGLFFIGIILSILFVSAAVLILYYKQIVEGYEDKNRFQIMQKLGMTKREIRESINSQLLTVFFMPLVVAGIHLCFAFPIIQKMLLMFNLNNATLFIIVTIISFLLFGLFYAFVYRITSNSYYNIVSSQQMD